MAEYVEEQQALRRAERAADDVRERKRRKSCGVDGAPPLPPVPPLPPPFLDDLAPTLTNFGSTQGSAGRTFRMYARMEQLVRATHPPLLHASSERLRSRVRREPKGRSRLNVDAG